MKDDGRLMDSVEAYRSQFGEFTSGQNGEPPWVTARREEAFDRFATKGFPRRSDEEWRATSVSPILSTSFRFPAPSPNGQSEAMAKRFRLAHWHGNELVFINGRLVLELSTRPPLPEGVVVASLEEALSEHPDLVEGALGAARNEEETSFAALNEAFLSAGVFIYLPKGTVLDEPVHVLYLTVPDGDAVMTHVRNVIVAESDCEAKIVESYAGPQGSVYFQNVVTEVVLGPNAKLDHYKLQRESKTAFHLASLGFRQERDSVLTNHSLSLGAALARNDIHVKLDGTGSECTLNGLYDVDGRQHVDHHTVIDHASPHASSCEFYKGVLDDQARGVFNGRIIVRPDAQKTDARQTNRNLLLSREALVDSNPQLEIYADDVKCAHGATIGQLDEEALFYLRSRGIPLDEARNLLTQGFVREVADRIRVPSVRMALEGGLFGEPFTDSPWSSDE